MSNTNWDMRNSVNWGSMGSHNSLARVSLICGVVDVRGLDDFLDGVDLVGSWDMDGTGNRNFIRLSDMGDLDDLTGNSTWDSNGDINVLILDIDLWNNVGDLRGDSGVGSDGSSDLLLNNSVSRSGSSWDRCGRDGSIRCWGSRDGWRGNGDSFNDVLGSSGNIRMGRLGDGFLSSNGISVSSNNLLGSSLDGSMSNNSIFYMVLNHWGSSSIAKTNMSNMSYKRSSGSSIGTSHKCNSHTKSKPVNPACIVLQSTYTKSVHVS